MNPTNARRAARFAKMLRRYDIANTDEGCLTDLLTDARHWCDRERRDFAEHDRRAYRHYVAEVTEECGR